MAYVVEAQIASDERYKAKYSSNIMPVDTAYERVAVRTTESKSTVFICNVVLNSKLAEH